MMRDAVRGLAIIMVTIAVPSSVLAHAVYEPDWNAYTYEDEIHCVHTESKITHGGGGGRTHTLVTGRKLHEAWDLQCAAGWNRPPQRIRGKTILMKYRKASSEWAICRGGSMPWRYNDESGTQLAIRILRGKDGDTSKAPCGGGWYGVFSLGQIEKNGSWRPVQRWSHIWSGPHKLPDRT